MKINHILSILSIAFVCIISLRCQGEKDRKDNEVTKKEPTPITSDSPHTSKPSQDQLKENQNPEFYGIIQSSGLSEKEKSEFTLDQYSNFQIITESNAYYLQGGQDFTKWWGQCVKMTGKLDSAWTTQYTMHPYGRSALKVITIGKAPYQYCIKGSGQDTTQKNIEDLEHLTGVIRRTFRPAPDIPYDYVLILKNPFVFEESQMMPNERITKIRLAVLDKTLYPDLEKYVETGDPVVLTGKKTRGYAEKLTFLLQGIDPYNY